MPLGIHWKISEYPRESVFLFEVVWALSKGFSSLEHRQRGRNNMADRFGCRQTPFYFSKRLKVKYACFVEFLSLALLNMPQLS